MINFPAKIQFTLGPSWIGTNGLSEDVVIVLTETAGGGVWTEDGTETANASTNRLRFAPADGVGTGNASVLIQAVTASGVVFSTAAQVVGGAGEYDWREVWNDGGASVTTHNTSFIGATPSYKPGIFKAIEDAGKVLPQGVAGGDGGATGDVVGIGQVEGQAAGGGGATGEMTGVGEVEGAAAAGGGATGEMTLTAGLEGAAGGGGGATGEMALLIALEGAAGGGSGAVGTLFIRERLKHADFEGPAFGEFASGAEGSGGGVSLSQTPAASFPDRGTIGLEVALTAGVGDKFVSAAWGSTRSRHYNRFVFNPNTVDGGGGGAVVIAQALDHLAAEVYNAEYDPATRVLTVTLAGGLGVMSVTLVSGLLWFCIEVGVDAIAGTATLWVNGIEADTASGSFSALEARSFRLGGISKDAATTGVLFLDEWKVQTFPVGLVTITPDPPETGVFPAEDPARWLVIYNTDVADSVAWVETYRVLRGIPYANLVGLAMGTGEALADLASYRSTIRDPLLAYINLNHPDPGGNIRGLLVGHRTPGVVTAGGPGPIAISSLLRDLTTEVEADNPDYLAGLVGVSDLPARLLAGVARYLTAEINAPSLALANAISTNAGALKTTDAVGRVFSALTPGSDRFGGAAASWPDGAAFIDSLGRQQLRLPDAAGFDGSEHGASIEVTDSTDLDITIDDQRRAVLLTSGAGMAAEVN